LARKTPTFASVLLARNGSESDAAGFVQPCTATGIDVRRFTRL
jgi:hypothetical protein